jgi:hypothetical protein
MYVSVRRYKAEPRFTDRIFSVVNESFLPILRSAPGFNAYYILDGGGGAITSISIFEDKAGAINSNILAAEFVEESLGDVLPTPLEIIEGEVVGSAQPAS